MESDFAAIPLINAPMDKVCSPALLECLSVRFNMPTTIHRWFKTPQDQIEFFRKCNIKEPHTCFLSVGNLDKWKEWIDYLIICSKDKFMNFSFLVDMANGDTQTCVDTVAYIRSRINCNIMAGNVATKSGYCRLEEAGANFIRTGIGGGSACSTREKNGFGVPTLTSVFDCASVKSKSYLIADGGIEHPGDICKAMAAGADMVMIGKMFAATSLSAGEKFTADGDQIEGLELVLTHAKYVAYRGMASAAAAKSLESHKSHTSVEGVSGFIPYTGPTEEVIQGVIGNLKSSLAYYAGCRDWIQFKKRVKFCEITQQGWGESVTRVLHSIG
jgi:IMP dehydrogenase